MDREEDTSSEEEQGGRTRRRSSSTDRRGPVVKPRESPGRNGAPVRARSERDLSKVTTVKVGQAQGKEAMLYKQRTKMKTTTIISNNGTMIVNQPVARGGGGRGEVTTAPLSRELAERTAETLQAAADDLVKLYKRISLDDDLDDHLRRYVRVGS